MILEKIINVLNVKEAQALAYTGVLAKKLDKNEITYEKLQSLVDNYCNNLAKGLIKENLVELKDGSNLQSLKKFLHSVGADKPYSGKRVHEALYKKLNNLEENINEIFTN